MRPERSHRPREDRLADSVVLLLHAPPCLLVGLKLCQWAAPRLAAFNAPAAPFHFYPWVFPLFSASKPIDLLLYALILATAALAFSAVCLLEGLSWRPGWTRSPSVRHALSGRLFGWYKVCLAALDLSLIFNSLPEGIHGPVLCFGTLFSLFYWRRGREGLDAAQAVAGRWLGPRSPAWKILFAAPLAGLFWMFLPFLQGELLMINEYWALPESTWLAASGRWVDNTGFINSRHILGLRKPEIRTGPPPALSEKPALREEEEREFLDKNRFELIQQILDRGVIHHHDFLLTPLMESALGRDQGEIHAQYGMLSIVALKYLLGWTGGVTYQNYFRVWYSFWPIYYSLYLALVVWLLKDLRYAVLAALLAFASINATGFHFIFVGSGHNPVRHIFDLPILACVALYGRRKRLAFLLAGFLLSLAAILNSSEFGLAALGALAVCSLWTGAEEKNSLPLAETSLSALALLLGWFLVSRFVWKAGPLVKYYLGGLLGFPVALCFFPTLVLALAGGYAVLWLSEPGHPLKPPAIFLFFYSQGMLVYYVWSGADTHILYVVPTLLLAALLLFSLLLDLSRAKRWADLALSGAALLALPPYLSSWTPFFQAKHDYEQAFKDHKVYQWDLPLARFRSTMDPTYFSEAVSLIDRYAEGKAFYLLSKYDDFLPFLSGRYSALPFHVSWHLMTPAESRECVETISKARPRYLFVDSDMDWDPKEGIARSSDAPRIAYGSLPVRQQPYDFPFIETTMRADRIQRLKEVFDQVRGDYDALERRALITVYVRKGL